MSTPGGTVGGPPAVTSYTYDDFGNVATTTQPNGATTATVYDGFGELILVTDTDGNVTQYAYDGMGRQVLNQIYATAGTSGTPLPWTYTYDAFGDQIQSDDRDGHIIDSTYDSLGRKLSDTWVGSANNYSSTYTYNALSEPVTAGDNNSQYSFSYDDQQYLQSEGISYAGLSNQTFGLGYSYNLQGVRTNLSAAMTSGGSTTDVFDNVYTPDGLGRITGITQTGPGLTPLAVTMNYTNDGQFQSIQRWQGAAGSCPAEWPRAPMPTLRTAG